MLAYVFWHWSKPSVAPQQYERYLIDFQRDLAETPIAGFFGSVVFRIPGAPWTARPRAYEDWYLVEGSAALDPLNLAAVSELCKERHDRAASAAAGGTAGLYRLRLGKPDFNAARFSLWMSKAEGVPYSEFYDHFETLTRRPGVSLWGRQMVLGPTPEFCLLSPEPVAAPVGGEHWTYACTRLWPTVARNPPSS